MGTAPADNRFANAVPSASPRTSEPGESIAPLVLDDTDQDVLFSVAGVWAVIIKNSLRRGDFHVHGAALRTAAVAAGMGNCRSAGIT